MERVVPAAIRAFLAQRRIAVAGVSRDSRQPANAIFRKLREAGYEVFAVNPAVDRLEGVRSFPDLGSIPAGVDAVMVVTPPAAAPGIVAEAGRLGIAHVWLHRSIGEGSLSPEAIRVGNEAGIQVIAGGCPMMFVPPVDGFHRCLGWWCRRTGRMPAA